MALLSSVSYETPEMMKYFTEIKITVKKCMQLFHDIGIAFLT